MIDRSLFEHPLLDISLREMEHGNFFAKEVMYLYENYEQKKLLPDLLGKTVKVTDRQLPKLYNTLQTVREKIESAPISMFVYEDFYYGLESKGLSPSWIEISAKTVTDFTDNELMFLIGREIGKVKMNYLYYFILMEEAEKAIHHQLIDSELLKDSWQIIMHQWSRLAHYSMDCFGYAVCGDLGASISAIAKLVLNSSFLAKQLDISEYIHQCEELQNLDDPISLFSKKDERVPYAPLRIRHLIRYASSNRGIQAVKHFHNRGILV